MFRKIKNKKLELVIYVVTLFVFIMLFTGGINIYNSCNIINHQANKNFISTTDGIRKSFNRYFRSAEEESEHCKKVIELTIDGKKLAKVAPISYKYNKYEIPYLKDYSKSILSPILLYSTKHVEGLEGIYFILDPEYFVHKDVIGLWYAYSQQDNKLHLTNNGPSTEMYPENRSNLEWFYIPKKLKRGVWSRPYIDIDLKIPMVTYSTPVYSDKKFLGIMGIDISMDKIREFIYKFNEYKTGEIYLINNENRIIFAKGYNHPEKSEIIDSYLYKFLDETYIKNSNKSRNNDIRLIKSSKKLYATVKLYNGFILVVSVQSRNLYGEINKLVLFTSFSLLFMVLMSVFIAMSAYSKVKKINDELLHKEKLISIGTLSAGIAHEINNPLGYLKCNMDTLKNFVDKVRKFMLFCEIEVNRFLKLHPGFNKEFEDIENIKSDLKIGYILDCIDELVEESQEGIKRVSDIIVNLKNFSKNDSQKEKTSEYVEEIVNEALKILNSKLSKGILLVKNFDIIPPLYCNKNGLVQVMVNMIDNACQAFDEDSKAKRIVVSIYKKGKNAFIEIEDNGTGIEKSKIKRIFESFYTTKAQGQGTGLGLSITYEIVVNNHNGEIFVESEKNKGTKFIIKMPYKKLKKTEGENNGL